MKKGIILLIFSFLICTNVYAKNVVNIDINIDESGISYVKENISFDEKISYKESISNIKDIKLECNNKKNKYKYNKVIEFLSSSKDCILTYTVNNLINKYNDTYGINYLYQNKNDVVIDDLNVVISSNESLDKDNVGIYLLGKNTSVSFNKGKIYLYKNNVKSNEGIHLLSTLTKNDYTNYNTINNSFIDYYKKINGNIKEEMNKNISYELLIGIVFLFIIITYIVIKLLLDRKKVKKKYKNIKVKNQKLLQQEIDIYDIIPVDLYTMNFLCDYFNILKNESLLLGMIFYKWIVKGYISVLEKSDNIYLVFKDISLDEQYEDELYKILYKSSKYKKIDKNRMSNIVLKKELNEWYNNVILNVLNTNKNIELIKNTYYLNDNIIRDFIKIKGLKRYMLTYNRMPKKKSFTNDYYINLYCSSIILGVDKSLSFDILRKNPEDYLAKTLRDMNTLRDLYKDIIE